MKRFLTSAAAAAVLVAGTGSGAQAQDASASLFDLGLYGGVAYHYNWLEDLQAVGFTDDRLNPGFAPAMGAHATFWTNPSFGIRTNVTYSWIDMPENSVPDGVNGWLYDLNLVFRPFYARPNMSRLMSSFYVFVGGGGFTANPPGGDTPGCVQPYVALAGACLPLEADKATVGQGTAGLGWDVVSLSKNVGVFTEFAVNGYDSPFHTGQGWTGMPDNERDTFGWTGRMVAGLKFSFGELAPAYIPPPVQPTPPPAPVTPPPPAAPATRTITICVVENGELRDVTATFTPSTGDTTVNNRAFSAAYPASSPTYASGATWYINNDSITVAGQEYVRFGVARVVPRTQLTRVGEFQGTPIFGQTGAAAPHDVLYIPLRPGCEFQPYQLRQEIRVRG